MQATVFFEIKVNKFNISTNDVFSSMRDIQDKLNS